MTAHDNTPPADKDPAATTDDAQPDDLGAATTVIGAEPAWMHLATDADGRGSVKVRAEWLDDEQGSVGLTANLAGGELSLSVEPADARRLAAKLKSAAAYAEGEDR
jgi:hypothetical protein